MNAVETETLTVTVEREIPFPPEKIWRALTQPHLIQEWLMKSDFVPAVDHRFSFRADWGSVDCKVLTIEAGKTLSYTWAAMGLDSVVTWTLTPTAAGVLLRMEQSGFRLEDENNVRGANYGWQRFVDGLARVVAALP